MKVLKFPHPERSAHPIPVRKPETGKAPHVLPVSGAFLFGAGALYGIVIGVTCVEILRLIWGT